MSSAIDYFSYEDPFIKVKTHFFEKLYPYKGNITIASIEDCNFLVEKFGSKGFVQNKSKEPLHLFPVLGRLAGNPILSL